MYYYNNNSYEYHIGDPLPTLPPGQVKSQSVPTLPPLPTNSPLVPNPQANTSWLKNLIKNLPASVKNADGTLNWGNIANQAKNGANWAMQAMQARKQAQAGYNGSGINPGTNVPNNTPKRDNTLMYGLLALGAIALFKNK